MLFYIIFVTNLLTQSPVSVSVFSLFLSFTEKEYQTKSKRNKTFSMIFLGPEDIQRTWRGGQKVPEEATSLLGMPHGGACPEGWWAPRRSPNPNLCAINSQICFRRRKPLFPWDPILGPFPAIYRRGIQSRRASTSTLLPFRWCVSSLPQTYGSIASS
jgi:hypothetical protein